MQVERSGLLPLYFGAQSKVIASFQSFDVHQEDELARLDVLSDFASRLAECHVCTLVAVQCKDHRLLALIQDTVRERIGQSNKYSQVSN